MAGCGEAVQQAVTDEAELARSTQTGWGADDLLGQALSGENMLAAWKRVQANKGSAGVDGCTVQETGETSRQRGPRSASGCSMAATNQDRCAGWVYRNRVAGRASWGYRP